MDKRSKNRLPEQCLFMNANGEIMSIEYGKSGFRRSKLSTENRQANREIVNSYNEKHGITAEQVKIMRNGALFGWDDLHAPQLQQNPSVKGGCIFEMEISRPGTFGENTTAEVSLPATPYELTDAMDKACVIDVYTSEILSCELEYLPQLISPNANLYELNHLAHRLSSLSEWELDCFEGMVMMDTIQTQYAPIALDRLINMTHSMEHCQIAREAHDDLSLGKFYAENGFVQELETLPEGVFPWLDYSKIGKEMREGEGGVFTPHGYVVQNGEISQTYRRGDATPLERPDYTAIRWFTLAAAQGNIYAQFFLDHMDSFKDPSVLLAGTRLLHHMSRVFVDNAPPIKPSGPQIDRKRRLKLSEKKRAAGHAIGDHEQTMSL